MYNASGSVDLPSGDGCSIEVSPAPISELTAAQQHFQRVRLTARGQRLDPAPTLSEAGLQDGDVLAAVVQLGKLAANCKAVAWHGCEGEVVT